VKATQWRLGLALTLAALAALGAWDYSTTRGNGISVYRTPYRVEMDCMRYSTRTGRVTMRIAVRNITRRPIRFRGHVFVTIRHDLPTTPDGRKHWHPYAMARGHSPPPDDRTRRHVRVVAAITADPSPRLDEGPLVRRLRVLRQPAAHA
jgi:hypothetical protein